jgi:hypothetical protein
MENSLFTSGSYNSFPYCNSWYLLKKYICSPNTKQLSRTVHKMCAKYFDRLPEKNAKYIGFVLTTH